MKIPTSLILGWLALRGMAMAGSIDWGTAAFDKLYNADGAALDSSFHFELGTFRNSFVPNATNTNLWEARWKRIEEAGFDPLKQYAAENSILTTSGSNLVWEKDLLGDESEPLNPNVFLSGEKVYVWVFNNKTINATAQWALVTGNGATQDTKWELESSIGNALAMTREWRLSNASTSLFGGLNDLSGPGNYRARPSSFTLQTALLSPIPEPSASCLLTAVSLLSFYRRRAKPSAS